MCSTPVNRGPASCWRLAALLFGGALLGCSPSAPEPLDAAEEPDAAVSVDAMDATTVDSVQAEDSLTDGGSDASRGPADTNPCGCPPLTACQKGVCIRGTCQVTDLGYVECDDGNPCTTESRCFNGKCAPYAAPPLFDCDDGKPCTADSCHPDKGCSNLPSPSGCDDGSPCSEDLCKDGSCAYAWDKVASATLAVCHPKPCTQTNYIDTVVDSQVTGTPVAATTTNSAYVFAGTGAFAIAHGGGLQWAKKEPGLTWHDVCALGPQSIVTVGTETIGGARTLPITKGVARVWDKSGKLSAQVSPSLATFNPQPGASSRMTACASLPDGRVLIAGLVCPAMSCSKYWIGGVSGVLWQWKPSGGLSLVGVYPESKCVWGTKSVQRVFAMAPIEGGDADLPWTYVAGVADRGIHEYGEVFGLVHPVHGIKPISEGCYVGSHHGMLFADALHTGGQLWVLDFVNGYMNFVSELGTHRLRRFKQAAGQTKPTGATLLGNAVGHNHAGPTALAPHGAGRVAALAGGQLRGTFDATGRRVVHTGLPGTGWRTLTAGVNEGLVGAEVIPSPSPDKPPKVRIAYVDAWGYASCKAAGICAGRAVSDCDDGAPETADSCTTNQGCIHKLP